MNFSMILSERRYQLQCQTPSPNHCSRKKWRNETERRATSPNSMLEKLTGDWRARNSKAILESPLCLGGVHMAPLGVGSLSSAGYRRLSTLNRIASWMAGGAMGHLYWEKSQRGAPIIHTSCLDKVLFWQQLEILATIFFAVIIPSKLADLQFDHSSSLNPAPVSALVLEFDCLHRWSIELISVECGSLGQSHRDPPTVFAVSLIGAMALQSIAVVCR